MADATTLFQTYRDHLKKYAADNSFFAEETFHSFIVFKTAEDLEAWRACQYSDANLSKKLYLTCMADALVLRYESGTSYATLRNCPEDTYAWLFSQGAIQWDGAWHETPRSEITLGRSEQIADKMLERFMLA